MKIKFSHVLSNFIQTSLLAHKAVGTKEAEVNDNNTLQIIPLIRSIVQHMMYLLLTFVESLGLR